MLSFVNIVILAHFLTPSDFGKVGVLAIFTTVGATIADTGMGGSLIKEKNLTKTDCSTVFVYNFFCSILLYGILFFSAPSISSFFNDSQLTDVCRIICLPIVINALTIVPRSLCMKELRFDKIFIVSISAALISMLIAIVMAIKDYGVWALVIYFVAIAVFENVGYYIINKYLPSIKFDVNSFKKLFSFGFFTALSSLVDTIYENILSVILGRYMVSSDVGYYSQAKKIEEVPSKSITLTINNVAFSQLSRLSENREDFLNKATSIQNTLLIISSPILVILSLFSDPIIRLCFGEKWLEASPYLSILCIAGLFGVIENTNRTFLKSLGRSDIMFKLSLIKRSLGLFLIFICIIIKIQWVLWAYVISSFFCACINGVALDRIIGYKIMEQVYDWIKLLMPLAVIYILISPFKVYIVSTWSLILITSVTIGVLHFFVLYLLKVKETRSMFNVVKKFAQNFIQ